MPALTHRTAVRDVLEGVYAAANVASVTAIGAVYNHVPQGATLPYLEISAESQPWDRFGNPGARVIVELEAVSQYRGIKECDDLINAAMAVLDNITITVTNHTLCNVRFMRVFPPFYEVVNNIETTHQIAQLEVYVVRT